ncbi:MAG: hypothetical protein ACSLEL_03535 [Candidatus Malihini olakiniferum]
MLWDGSLVVDGIKTGYTNAAGYNLFLSAKKDKIRSISVEIWAHFNCKTESKKLLR